MKPTKFINPIRRDIGGWALLESLVQIGRNDKGWSGVWSSYQCGILKKNLFYAVLLYFARNYFYNSNSYHFEHKVITLSLCQSSHSKWGMTMLKNNNNKVVFVARTSIIHLNCGCLPLGEDLKSQMSISSCLKNI